MTAVPAADKIVEKDGKKFKILEIPIDPPMTVKRMLVPADTEENETPEGSRLLDERESEGIMARSASPEKFRKGEPVRLAADPTKTGSIIAIMKSGMIQVRWNDTGLLERLESKLLHKMY